MNDSNKLIAPPLNTDIKFSETLPLHYVSQDIMPFTPTITSGVNTPIVNMNADIAFSDHLKLHSVTYGYNPREHSHLADLHPKTLHIHHKLPDNFSWCLFDTNDNKLIKIKKSLISKPKSQYACGSCFAICMAQVFSDCLVVSGAVGWSPNISETWLMANLPSRLQKGCGGGNPALIAPYLEKYGALDTSCIDYSWCENDKDICARIASTQHFDSKLLTETLNAKIPKKGCWFSQKKFLYKLDSGSDVFFINPEAPTNIFRQTVKSHILDFGPCVGGFVVLGNFISGKHTNTRLSTKGIYFERCFYDGWLGVSWSETGKPKGLHAVAIVGWGEETNVEYAPGKYGTVPYWHCRNSWGENWGYQGGLFKIAMYPFNQYSQLDKEVMTSLGGPVGSMVLLRATQHPSIVDTKQVEEKYRLVKRSLTDLYYQAAPEAVVLYNRQRLDQTGDDKPLHREETSYDIVTFNKQSTSMMSIFTITIVVLFIYYITKGL